MTTLTRRYGFSASHRLFSKQLADDRNREIFGKCSNEHGHGHNYRIAVSVEGTADPRSGMVLARGEFDRWVRRSVLDRVDHTHLNDDVAEFRDLVPTAENIVAVIEMWLRDSCRREFPGRPVRLSGLLLEETPRNSFELLRS